MQEEYEARRRNPATNFNHSTNVGTQNQRRGMSSLPEAAYIVPNVLASSNISFWLVVH